MSKEQEFIERTAREELDPSIADPRAYVEAIARHQAPGDERDEGPLEQLVARWARRPVPIDRFVEQSYYLGLRGQVWPRVMDILVEITTGDYTEIVFTGGLGYGKSYMADLLMIYMIYQLSCMRDPYISFGLAHGFPIVAILQSVTETKARRVLFEGAGALVRRSPYFTECFRPNPRLKSELAFPGGIVLRPVAGNEAAAIGENVVAGTLDEVNFLNVVADSQRGETSAGTYDTAVANHSALVRRRKSRFLDRGTLPGWVIVVSSSRYPGDFTERKLDEAKTDPTIYTKSLPTWATKPKGKFLGPTFRVAVGTQYRRTRILAEDEPTPTDQEVVEPPIEFLPEFQKDPDQAARDIAGKPTAALHPFIRRRELVAGIPRAEFRHPFSLETSTLRDGLRILTEHLHAAARAPRACHMDLSKNRDATGLVFGYSRALARLERTAIEVAGADAAGRAMSVEVDRDGRRVFVEQAPIIVLEGMLRIVAPPGDEIHLADVVGLVVALRNAGVPIRWVTADDYQSLEPLQTLREQGFVTGVLSVDKDPRPYEELKSAIYDLRLESYAYGPFVAEVLALEKNERTGKVDHPQWLVDAHGDRVRGSKDVTDGAAGVVSTLMRQAASWREDPDERPYDVARVADVERR